MGLSGTIASGLSDLSMLTMLDISQNLITGPVTTLFQLPRLEELYAWSNLLSGELPSTISATQLTSISLAFNYLGGSVSPSFTSMLPNLRVL